MAAAAMVRQGAPDLPYGLVHAGTTVKTGDSTYQGCDAFRETAISDVYSRADGTEYVAQLGAGTPEGPVNVCVTTTVKSAEVQLSRYCQSGVPTTTWGLRYHAINKNDVKNAETGEIVGSTCVEVSARSQQTGSASTSSNSLCGQSPPSLFPWGSAYWTPFSSTGGDRYNDNASQWPGYEAVYGASCPSGF